MTAIVLSGPDDDEPRDEAEVFDLAEQRRRRSQDPDPTEPDIFGDDRPDLLAEDNDEDEFDDDAPLIPFRAIVRTVSRHPRYVAAGGRTVARRTWESRTTARHQRMMRAAEAAGDHESVLEWEERVRSFRAERHTRRMAMLAAPVHAARAVLFGTMTAFGLLVLLGILLALATKHVSEVAGPLMTAVHLTEWLVNMANLLWRPAAALAFAAALASLWRLGREQNPVTAWEYGAADEDGDGRELVPDESAILSALRHLNLGPLNQAVKNGWQPRWVLGAVQDGQGWHSQLLLPQGVTVEMVNAKKNTLASNLLRKPVEVWPTEPDDKPGVLDLWVANPGALTGPVPPWPLLTSGTCDYFKGVPVAVALRGNLVTAPLFQKNYMVGGIMGTGKSSATRNLVLGAALDPLVEIEVYVMAYNADYDAMRRRLRVLVKGDDDQQIEAALGALRRLRSEVTLRGQLLEDAGEMKVTRKLAEADARLRPLVVVFDECHELFEHETCGQEAAELAVKVLKKARKCAITLIFTTVSPTATSIPKDVTRNTSNRVAFAVGDHVANDGLLGTGKHRAGITATKLNPAVDIGTSLTIGFSANPFDLVRWHYVQYDPEKNVDQITPVIDRAMTLRERAEHESEQREQVPNVDPLVDIAHVMGGAPRMLTREVLRHLANLRPDYLGWNGETLRAYLADEEIDAEPHKSNGLMTVDGSRIIAALARRRASDADSGESA